MKKKEKGWWKRAHPAMKDRRCFLVSPPQQNLLPACKISNMSRCFWQRILAEYQHSVYWQISRTVCTYRIPVQCVLTECQYTVFLQNRYPYSVCSCRIPVQCVLTEYQYSVYLQISRTVCTYRIPVQCVLTEYQYSVKSKGVLPIKWKILILFLEWLSSRYKIWEKHLCVIHRYIICK